jgi:hypothetical protein
MAYNSEPVSFFAVGLGLAPAAVVSVDCGWAQPTSAPEAAQMAAAMAARLSKARSRNFNGRKQFMVGLLMGCFSAG